MTRFFMTIPEAVHLVLQAGGDGRGRRAVRAEHGRAGQDQSARARTWSGCPGFAPDEIPIVFTGMRPGEKLEERLWEDSAVVSATAHPDIMRVAEPQSVEPVPLDALLAAAHSGDRMEIEMLITRQVASYVPSSHATLDA